MRKEFELTDKQLKEILAASRPTPVMYLSGGQSMFDSPQENANRVWAKLGEKLGFDHMSVRPISGKGQKFFTAEAADQHAEREG